MNRCAFGMFSSVLLCCVGSGVAFPAIDAGHASVPNDANTTDLVRDAFVPSSTRDATSPVIVDAASAVDASVDASVLACGARDIGLLPKALDELSGLALSRRHADVLYAHNDSGDTARFFALSSVDARLLATFSLSNVLADDWEDIAVGPCATEKGSSCVYLADIGDNNLKRENVVIYELPEPTLSSDKRLSATAHTFRYPDGPQNAETLLVHPQTGQAYVVGKAFGGASKMYRVTLRGANSMASREGSVSLPGGLLALATGGSFHPDGKRFALRTYGDLFEYAWPLSGVAPKELVVPSETQGEAVSYSADGLTWYTASEGKDQVLHATSCIRP